MTLSYLKKFKDIFNKKFFESEFFLYSSCGLVLIISLIISSLTDIGPDSTIYINIGKKIAEGGKYYHDYFESNLPFNFYPYAIFYWISNKTILNHILIAQIGFYLMFFFSFYCSTQIIKKTKIYDQKLLVNFLYLGFFLGFFLRPISINFNETGTKSTFFMLFFFPYLLYSLEFKNQLTKKDLILRGLLMGMIPCFKPHYLIVIIVMELFRIFYNKFSLKIFYQLDYLVFALTGMIALNILIHFEHEYIEFMVPMWKKIYVTYRKKEFISRAIYALGVFIIPTCSCCLILVRFKKLEYNLKLLTFALFGYSLTLISEALISCDQVSIFFFVLTIFISYLITQKQFFSLINFLENKFIIISLLYCSFISLPFFLAITFGVNSIFNLFWIILPIYSAIYYKKNIFSLKFFIAILSFNLIYLIFIFKIYKNIDIDYNKLTVINLINLLLIIIIMAIFEKKYYSKISNRLSMFSTFIVLSSIISLFSSYVNSVKSSFNYQSEIRSPNMSNDLIGYYIKKFAPKSDQKVIFFGANETKNPVYSYSGKYNFNKLTVFPSEDFDLLTDKRYLYQTININEYYSLDLAGALFDKSYKLIIFKNTYDFNSLTQKVFKCNPEIFERIVGNKKLKKYLKENFYFVTDFNSYMIDNHALESKIKINNQIYTFTQNKKNYDHVIIYARKENK